MMTERPPRNALFQRFHLSGGRSARSVPPVLLAQLVLQVHKAGLARLVLRVHKDHQGRLEARYSRSGHAKAPLAPRGAPAVPIAWAEHSWWRWQRTAVDD